MVARTVETTMVGGMGSAAKGRGSTTALLTAVLAMTLLVLALGGAVVAVKLRGGDEPPPASPVEALAELEAAVRADPKDDVARTALGLAYLEAGRPAEARRAFEAAVRLNDRNWVAAYQLGLLVRGEDPDRAVALLTDAAKRAPRMSKAGPLVALGDLLMDQGRAAEARDAYRRAVADVPYLLDAHLGLARALEALGDLDAALREYEEAARFDPQNAEIAEAIRRLRQER